MPLQKPTACRAIAFETFRQELSELHTTAGLVRTATAIAMHELDHVSPDDVEQQLSALAGRVRRRVRSENRKALLAHLHEELFEKSHFHGNADNYYCAHNSYLPLVLESGRGIPITLSMVYVSVARRLGLRADGINAPGHFLVQVSDGGKPYLVDPFFCGMVLSREDAYQRLEHCLSMPVDRDVELLKPATHHQWIQRTLLNLVQLFDAEERIEDKLAIVELSQLLADKNEI